VIKPARTTNEYYQGILAGNRVILAQAITLVESDHPDDRSRSDELLNQILSHTGKAMRIGITGVPGVGKSAFIESLGGLITSSGKKLAVLTIDPSSQLTRGSILGDKTRMPTLAKNEMAFIRPSASGLMTGGVGSRTRESTLLCEAAGFEVIIIETVGVGQSETAVRNMVDFFLLLMLAGAGDELQGIKKGIIEMADALVITKADGANMERAFEAQSEFRHALHLLPGNDALWKPRVLTCSALTGEGIAGIWSMIQDYEASAKTSGYLQGNREAQKVHWLKTSFDHLIRDDLARRENLNAIRLTLEEKVKKDEIAVSVAARKLLAAYYSAIRGNNS
jgi:LAO/AO transport system kinase